MLLLAGCSLIEPPVAAPPEAVPDVERAPESPAETLYLNPAAAQFLADARNWIGLDNPSRAAISMERAIRIAPDHPEPWLALAALRLNGGDVSQAENLALKARNLSPRGSSFFERAEAMLVEIQRTPL